MKTYTITINLRVQAKNINDAILVSECYVNELNQQNDCNAKLCSMYQHGTGFEPPTKCFYGEVEYNEIKYNNYLNKK